MAGKVPFHETIVRVTVVRRKSAGKAEIDTIEVKRRSTRPQQPLDTESLAARVFGEKSLPALVARKKELGKK